MSTPGRRDEPVLAIEELSVTFYVRQSLFSTRPVHAVREVDLVLTLGETVAVVGESGSGKTTLGRATLHLAPISAGRVVFEGTDVAELEGRDLMAFRQRAQVIFQDPFSSLSPYMRVGDLVAEPLAIHGPKSRDEQHQRVLASLEQVKLSPAAEFAEKYPHTLSGGQRQRVSIARAMVLEPDYLVADEPVSMIDASSRAEILYLLAELRAQGETPTQASAAHPAEIVIQRITAKLNFIAASSSRRSAWCKEALTRIEEGRYHPSWAAMIESL